MMDIDYAPKQPAAKFDYRIRTTQVMEHSRGVAWVADLMCGDVKIGTVEQEGNGGADRVYLSNSAYEMIWKLAVRAAFADDEEAATYYMLCAEEGI